MDDRPRGPSNRTGSLIDQHVGERLRGRRCSAGLSVATMAHALGVSADEVRSWESGECRIPASYLLATSDLLSCPLTAFFEGFPIEPRFEDEIERSEHDVTRAFNHYSDVKH